VQPHSAERQKKPAVWLPPDPPEVLLRLPEQAAVPHAQYSGPDVAAAQSAVALARWLRESRPEQQVGPQQAPAALLPAALSEVSARMLQQAGSQQEQGLPALALPPDVRLAALLRLSASAEALHSLPDSTRQAALDGVPPAGRALPVLFFPGSLAAHRPAS